VNAPPARGVDPTTGQSNLAGGIDMRFIKGLVGTLVCAAALLGTTTTASAERLSSFSFLDEAGADTFFTDGPNVRVSYRCTSRLRNGLIQVANKDDVSSTRRARARCDGVPRSVLLKVKLGENTVLLQQPTVAYASVAVFGRPFTCAACIP
jgi:hypothetical protein